jgi:hypothetical protein
MRWIGIDEAGYGPNIGPLVMTAVVAEDRNFVVTESHPDAAPFPDVWRDLESTVDRSGGDPRRLWVDDSKAIFRGGMGRDRLEKACLAVLDAVGIGLPTCADGLFTSLGAGTHASTEFARWVVPGTDEAIWPRPELRDGLAAFLEQKPLQPAGKPWRIVAARSVVIGPERFNALLTQNDSKARVHFAAFCELLQFAWARASDGISTHLTSDKHGGRHYYYEHLIEALPDTWVDRGVEGPALSRYRIRAPGRSMIVSLSPRADGSNGLVALASIVSKLVREVWMDFFNAYWSRRIDGLRPTAGYPVDAARFRDAIEPLALSLGLNPYLWWRNK